MTDEELAQYMEERRVQKAKNKKQAEVLTSQKQEIEAQRHVVLQEAGELDARVETNEQAYAKLLKACTEAKAELEELKSKALEKKQQEQGLALQVVILEAQIIDLLNNKQPSSQAAAVKNSIEKIAAAAMPAAREGVRISGATGTNAFVVNGVYEVTDEISGGMPVYKKQEGEQWLEYHVSKSRWMAKDLKDKGQDKYVGYACVACALGVLPDKASRGTWQVVDGVSWPSQASLVVTPVSAAEVAAEAAALLAACPLARAEATYAVRISGATGTNADVVNGVYEVTDEVSGGMPVYKKQAGDMWLQRGHQWLEYHFSKNRWMLKREADKGQEKYIGYACVASS